MPKKWANYTENTPMSDNLKEPWPEGKSGNPNGRPKGSKNRSTLVRELLEARLDENHTYAQAMTKAVMEKALSGDVQAWDKLFDSAWGKVTDKQELTNPDGSLTPQAITVKVVTKKE